MAVTEQPTERPIGYGRLLRKEDPRFLRGQGNYVDDIKLPGMLYGAVLRSPYAHARIKSIDTSAATSLPKVKAVINRQGPGAPQAGLDADAVDGHPVGPGHRQGSLPGSGGRFRGGRGQVLRP